MGNRKENQWIKKGRTEKGEYPRKTLTNFGEENKNDIGLSPHFIRCKSSIYSVLVLNLFSLSSQFIQS